MALLTHEEVTDAYVATRGTLENVVFRRVGCRETARDLTQDIFFKLDRLADRFAGYDDARRFLVRMAINVATDHYRVARRRAELLAELGPADEQCGLEDEIASRSSMSKIAEVLDELPSKCRDVIYLSRIEGLTHREIAERLGVSRSLIDKYSVRALLHCRVRLRDAS